MSAGTVERDYEALANRVMKAFVQFINDSHEWEVEQHGTDHVSPKAIGCCARCGFTVYRDGHDEMYHYSYQRGYETRCCGYPDLIEVQTK